MRMLIPITLNMSFPVARIGRIFSLGDVSSSNSRFTISNDSFSDTR